MPRMILRDAASKPRPETFGFVSVHIPKTGGQTLMRTLERRFGERLHYHHQSDFRAPLTFGQRLRQVVTEILPGDTCIHGHFPASSFWHPGATMFAFVRDPLERRISAWHYIRRELPRLTDSERNHRSKRHWRRASRMSLDEYLSLGDHVYQTFFDVPLDRFDLIGSMAEFDADMARLADLIGTTYVPEKLNTRPDPAPDPADPSLRKAFEAANSAEYALFEAALARREQILASGRFNAGRAQLR